MRAVLFAAGVLGCGTTRGEDISNSRGEGTAKSPEVDSRTPEAPADLPDAGNPAAKPMPTTRKAGIPGTDARADLTDTGAPAAKPTPPTLEAGDSGTDHRSWCEALGFMTPELERAIHGLAGAPPGTLSAAEILAQDFLHWPSEVGSLAGIECFPNLRVLVPRNHIPEDMYRLQGHSTLEHLSLGNARVDGPEQLRVLDSMPELRRVTMIDIGLTSLQGLELPSLGRHSLECGEVDLNVIENPLDEEDVAPFCERGLAVKWGEDREEFCNPERVGICADIF